LRSQGANEADTDSQVLHRQAKSCGKKALQQRLERPVHLIGKGMFHRLIARHDFSGDGGA
jgi:hypothetical protein